MREIDEKPFILANDCPFCYFSLGIKRSANEDQRVDSKAREGFQPTFWVQITLELFERLAFYGAKAVLTVYLAIKVGLGPQVAGSLAGLFPGSYSLYRSWPAPSSIGTGLRKHS